MRSCVRTLLFLAFCIINLPTSAVTEPATIRGQVVSSDGLPVSRALIAVSGSAIGGERTAMTRDDGRFELLDLPTAAVTVVATKAGYLPGKYGAKRPGANGRLVSLASGQNVEVIIRLWRSSSLSGTLTDGHNSPISNALMFAIDARRSNPTVGPNSDVPSVPARTDSRGRYRLFDLSPGSYFVVAFAPTPPSSRSIEQLDATSVTATLDRLAMRQNGTVVVEPVAETRAPSSSRRAFAATLFPGTPRRSTAVAIAVKSGEERQGLDFALSPVPVVNVHGQLTGIGAAGAATELSITILDTVRAFAIAEAIPQLEQRPDSEGRFSYRDVAPGRYRISARVRSGAESSAPVLYGSTEIDVDGRDVDGVSIPMTPGVDIGGRVVFASGSAPRSLTFPQLRVRLTAESATLGGTVGTTNVGDAFASSSSISPGADGTFRLGKMAPGTYFLDCTAPASESGRWWLRSATVNGVDILDVPIVVRPGQADVSMVLTMTDDHSQLVGSLTSDTVGADADYYVVVFPSDRNLWNSGSRRMKSVRASSDGSFVLSNLPAGEYYVAALEDIDGDEWKKGDFLSTAVSSSIKVQIRDGQTTTQSLKVGGRLASID